MSELQKENHPFLDFVSKNKKVLTYTVTAVVVALVAFLVTLNCIKNQEKKKQRMQCSLLKNILLWILLA